MSPTSPIALKEWHDHGATFMYGEQMVFFKMEGEGDALVCIHGFPTASWDWAWLWPDLTRRFQVLALDMMGFGFSEKPRGYTYSILDQADLIEELLEDLAIPSAHLLCHDYGDTVGQELLARANEGRLSFEIGSMCLLNGGLFPEVHRPRYIQKLLLSPVGALVGRLLSEQKFHKSFSEIFGEDTQPGLEELKAFWALIAHNEGQRIMHELIRYIPERVQYRDRWVGSLQDTSIPLRFINGLEDPVSGRHMVKRFAELIPDSDIVPLEGIGHYPQVEAPGATLNAFLTFIHALKSA